MTPLEHVIMCIQVLALVTIIGVCICRINAMGPNTPRLLKLAYIALSGGALSVLLNSTHTHPYIAMFCVGVALSLVIDRRKSACYDGECPVP